MGILGDGENNYDIPNLDCINLEDRISFFDQVSSFLFLGTSRWDSTLQDMLKESLLREPRPFFVANPDIIAPHSEKFSVEPAYYSFYLINDGINLPIWFGKPFPQIFEMALERIHQISGKIFNKSRIGMVGDTLHTDILGANSFGIKSILMTDYGFFKNERISYFLENTDIIPDFIVNGP